MTDHASGRTPVQRRWARNLYLAAAGLTLVGILTEGLLIGPPSLFSATTWGRRAHLEVGASILLLALLLPVLGLLAHLSGQMIISSAVLLVLALLQVIAGSYGDRVSFLATVHPANAMLMVGLTVLLLVSGWRERGNGIR